MKHPKIKLSIEEQLANKIAGIAAVEMRTFTQQLAYWVGIYEAKNGVVAPKQTEVAKHRRPMLVSPERRAQMREQGLKLAVAAKAKAQARRANSFAH